MAGRRHEWCVMEGKADRWQAGLRRRNTAIITHVSHQVLIYPASGSVLTVPIRSHCVIPLDVTKSTPRLQAR